MNGSRVRRCASFAIGVVGAVLAGGCTTALKVQFEAGRCLMDGAAATLGEVETRQAELTQHVLGRQPVLTGIAVAAVALASIGYLQRLWTVLALRRVEDQTFADRVRSRMARYRAHPVRYALLISGVLALLVAAGAGYVMLDADKRASERALATLQFCHLALRSTEEQHVLAEQREHLASIQTTERDIQTLVDKLPPAEQDKAHEIVGQLSSTLGQQREMVARYAEHADVAARQVTEHQAEVEKGLSKLDGEVGTLKSIPDALSALDGDVREVGTRARTLGGELEASTARVDTLSKQVDALSKQVEALAARPPPACAVVEQASPQASGVRPQASGPDPSPGPSPSPSPTPISKAPSVGSAAGSGTGSG